MSLVGLGSVSDYLVHQLHIPVVVVTHPPPPAAQDTNNHQVRGAAVHQQLFQAWLVLSLEGHVC
jgi:hypothetical protein